MSNSRNSPSLNSIFLKSYVPWFFFWVSRTTTLPLLPPSRRLLKLWTSIWVLSLVGYSWRWIFVLYANHSNPGFLRQNSEASLLLLLSIGSMLSSVALHLKISEEAKPPHTKQESLVINPLAVILTSPNWVLWTWTRGKAAVLPSLNDLVRIRRKFGLSSTKMPKVKARLLMRYPSPTKLLWNWSRSTSKQIFFLLAFYRHRKIMTWKTHLPSLCMWVGMKKTVEWM